MPYYGGTWKTTTKCIRIASIVAYKGEVTYGAKMFVQSVMKIQIQHPVQKLSAEGTRHVAMIYTSLSF